jgi:hypothetical protein
VNCWLIFLWGGVNILQMKPEVDPVWVQDVVIRTLLVITATLALALLSIGWRVPEMFAFGTVASVMAWFGPKAWRPWTTPRGVYDTTATFQEAIAQAWVLVPSRKPSESNRKPFRAPWH